MVICFQQRIKSRKKQNLTTPRFLTRGSCLFVSNKELNPGKNKTFIAFETLHHLPLPDIRDRLLGNEGEYETSIALETLNHLPLPDIRDRLLGNEGEYETSIAFETLHHLPLVRKRGGVRKNKTFIAFETLHHLPLPDIRDRLLGNEGEYETSIAFETLHHLPLVRKRGGFL